MDSENAICWNSPTIGNQYNVLADTKQGLLSFESKDDCINWLYLQGFKDEARYYNKQL